MSNDISGLIKWASSVGWRDKYDEISALHFGAANEFDLDTDELDTLLGDRAMELMHCAFEDLVSTIGEDGTNIVDDYLKRRGWKEGASTRAYMLAMRDSLQSIYEVSEIVPGQSFEARDLVRGGEPVLVSERTATRSLHRWDRLAARLVTVGGKTVMTGATLMFTPEAVQRALDDLAMVRAKLNPERLGDDPELQDALTAFTLKMGSAIISAAWLRDLLGRLTGQMQPEVSNVDGDPLDFTCVRYDFRRGVTQAKLRAALETIPGLYPAGRNFWNWVIEDEEPSKPRLSRSSGMRIETSLLGGASTFGDVEIEGRSLYVSVNSRERAEQAIERLEVPLAGLVGEPIVAAEDDEPTDGEMGAMELPPEAQAEIIEMLEAHYRKVLDEPLPLLDGTTPRDAIKTEAGRVRVADWLKLLENGHSRQDGIGGSLDFTWMWNELGLGNYRK